MKHVRDYRAFERIVREAGLQTWWCSDDHWQIIGGPLKVNYYPGKGTFYVAGTAAGRKGGIKAAIRAAKTPPPLAGRKVRRIQNTPHKRRMFAKSQLCHWCRRKLQWEEATVDHVVPLSRGGLHNHNNMVLACETCNRGRGNAMPELGEAAR